MAPRIPAPLLAAALALAGSLLSTLVVFGIAKAALDRVLEERLRGAGETAALMLAGAAQTDERLDQLMRVNSLEGASLVDRSLTVVADASGQSGRTVDLLRIDADRVAAAFEGAVFVGPGYAFGGLPVSAGYFPVRGSDGRVETVLALEAGEAFLAARGTLARARLAALLLSFAGALALGLAAARWVREARTAERHAQQADRAEELTRMAAMVAHEIRNPLGIIRGIVELMREREGDGLSEAQAESLRDLLAEVERLRRFTDDFLALGTPSQALLRVPVDLGSVLLGAARGVEIVFQEIRVRTGFDALPHVLGDPARLGQVFSNLLVNASQAIERGEIELSAAADGGCVRVRVHDEGPGLPPTVRERLFQPFVTARLGGTGLGLTVARTLIEQHGGTLSLAEDGRPGTTFEVQLPALRAEER